MAESALEAEFALQIRAAKLDKGMVREYKFHPLRRWRFDFCWPDHKFSVEVEGGVFTNGRHTRGAGYSADLEKYNEAVMLGWKVLRFTGSMVKSGVALNMVDALIGDSRNKATHGKD